MKVALIIWSMEPGGAQRVMSTLADHWAEDHEVTLVTLAGEIPDHFQLRDAVHRVRMTTPMKPPFPRAILRNAAVMRDLRRTLRRVRPDVVVSFMDRTNVQVLAATRGLGLPVVVSERTDPRFHRIPRRARLLRRILYPRADAVVVQTESVRSWCEAFVDPNKVWVIPNPVQPCSEDKQARERMVMGLGRLDRPKGFDVLVEAFARVSSVFPDWNLTIMGEGPERPMLEALARHYGIEDRLFLPGVVGDPGSYLSRAGVFVLPSRYEGFPNALLEAMACGAPSIAADCPSGPAYIIESGVDGILVPADDASSLSDALGDLMSDPDERERLGTEAQRSVLVFSPKLVLGEWAELIGKLVG